MTRATAVQRNPATAFGHPPGLPVLFFAEMWERFSFYGMRALLMFYLTKHWLFSDEVAAGIYATYGSLVYLTPVIGGLVADRYLGFRKAVAFGALLLVLGHVGMAVEGDPAVITATGVARDEGALQVFYLSLALIIVGVGFLKPNISGMVGRLYGPDDPRRDGGFTLFYMGINVGAFSASIVCGYLGETFGWRYGFGVAGLGMLLGLMTFLRGRERLEGAGEPPDPLALGRPMIGPVNQEVVIYGCGLLAVGAAWFLVQERQLVGSLLLLTGAAAVSGIVWCSAARCSRVERHRMLLVMLLTSVSVLFWALFEQAGSSMNLFADRVVDRQMGGVTIAASQLQSLNPAFIFLLAPLFAWAWLRLARAGREPGTPAKFAFALIQVGLGFAALVMGIEQADENGRVALAWLVLAYLLHTTGELCLSPVGLAMVTRLSVPRLVGLMMGVWFLASSAAHYVAGWIAALASVEGGAAASAEASLTVYASTFERVALVAVVAGFLLLLVSRPLRRLMHQGA